jgi:hypothetical protein
VLRSIPYTDARFSVADFLYTESTSACDHPGMRTIAVVAALAAVIAGAVAVAVADADPCARELAAASRRNAPPKAIEALRACRSRQKSKSAPWRRDGGASDADEYVKVQCPPGSPPWRVCEKKRSELEARDAGAP